MVQSLNNIIWNIAILTITIILLGIVSTAILANRIITPLRKLAVVAKGIASGDLNASVTPCGRMTKSAN